MIDPPGTGRAGFDVDDINLAATGQRPPFTSNPLSHGDSASWERWNLGPELGMLGDGILQGNQMATNEEAVKHFLAAMLPGRTIPDTDFSFIAALEKVKEMAGPAIFVG